MSIDAEQLTDTIVATKRLLREGLPRRAEVFAEVAEHIRVEVAEIRAAAAQGRSVIPQLEHAAVTAGSVSPEEKDEIRRRGVVIVRNVFTREQAAAWDEELEEYLTANGYGDAAVDPELDQYFETPAPIRPQIAGVYWSRPQVLARQSVNLAETRAFLNGLWNRGRSDAVVFDPTEECTYADRIRRRAPGDTSLSLPPHMDAGSVERWIDPGYREVYRHVYSGDWTAFDPFDAAHRTEVREVRSPALCSMFRTFQGWTALTRQGPGDGTLQVVPAMLGVVYLLLRALQDDVADDDLCGARLTRALRAVPQWHAELLEGLVSIPEVQPGDTVWWHPDVLHAVEGVHTGRGYSNVLYIAAAPACGKNRAYLERQRPTFLAGESPPDFGPEHHEVGYRGRGALADLTPLGRRQMGFEP
jgi:hypothetical protein